MELKGGGDGKRRYPKMSFVLLHKVGGGSGE